MKKRNVLILVNGPWQAVSCIAALRTLGFLSGGGEIYCLVVDMEKDSFFYKATTDLLLRFGIGRTFFVTKKISPRLLLKKADEIERAFGISFSAIDELLIFGYHRPVARFFCGKCLNAEITVYEEGIRTYIDKGLGAEKGLRKIRRLFDPAYAQICVDERFYEKAARVCLLLSPILEFENIYKNSKVIEIEKSLLSSLLLSATAPFEKEGRGDSAMSATKKDLQWPYPERFMLIVGQYYSNLNQMSEAEELAVYKDAATAIKKMGCRPVWRGHIRMNDAFFSALKSACPSLVNFNDIVETPYYPLEFFAHGLGDKCAGLVSISSSSLYYFKHLTAAPTYTLADDSVVENMKSPHADACRLAMQTIEPFKKLL